VCAQACTRDLQHWAQKIRPQCRQWCFRRTSENLPLHLHLTPAVTRRRRRTAQGRATAGPGQCEEAGAVPHEARRRLAARTAERRRCGCAHPRHAATEASSSHLGAPLAMAAASCSAPLPLRSEASPKEHPRDTPHATRLAMPAAATDGADVDSDGLEVTNQDRMRSLLSNLRQARPGVLEGQGRRRRCLSGTGAGCKGRAARATGPPPAPLLLGARGSAPAPKLF